MKFCQPHWDMLRAEVADLGLADWVAPDGATAIEQLADQTKRGDATPVNYDPLMAAHNSIFGRVLEGLGLMVMSADFGCPICFLQERQNPDGSCSCGHADCPNQAPGSLPDFETWLRGPDSAVAAAKAHMVEQGWIPA